MLPNTEKDLRTRTPPGGIARAPYLFLILEGDRLSAGGMRCPLGDVSEVDIGRGERRGCDGRSGRLVVTVPDPTVSTRHAQLVREGALWSIEDAGSTNGTFVNGRRVTREPLGDGDLIEVGHTLLRIRLAIPTPDTEESTARDCAAAGALGLPTLLPGLASEHAVLARVAPTRVPVLLLGDTGSGKEVTARAIHAASRRPGPFVAVNCAALPVALVEAQLFGHTKGAFSGAVRDEVGFVRGADRGTLFLDEVGDLPRAAQGALLRVLQEAEVVPLGTTRPIAVQVRVIAATHQPLETMVEQGDFRRDLFARLQGFTHRLWPLARRREDIGLLVADWLAQHAPEAKVRIAPEAARTLVRHGWPLNIRELVQVLARALVLAPEGAIEIAHLPGALAAIATHAGERVDADDARSEKDVALRAAIVASLTQCHGNVSAVARRMNKAPMQLYRWMQRLGIDPKAFR